MTAFGQMVDTLFSDPNLSAAATYYPKAGAEIALRIVPDREDSEQVYSPFEAKSVQPAYLIDIRSSDVATPQAGDAIVDEDGQRFVVRSFEARTRKAVWRLNVDKVG